MTYIPYAKYTNSWINTADCGIENKDQELIWSWRYFTSKLYGPIYWITTLRSIRLENGEYVYSFTDEDSGYTINFRHKTRGFFGPMYFDTEYIISVDETGSMTIRLYTENQCLN